MIFGAFRVIIGFFTFAAAILSVFALVGSYKDNKFLNNTYLINFQLTQLNLSTLLNAAEFSSTGKRDEGLLFTPIDLEKRVVATTTGWTGQLATTTTVGVSTATAVSTSGYLTTVQAVIQDIQSRFLYTDLGLADVYTIGYWGYCRGTVNSNLVRNVGTGVTYKTFDNSGLNITWCSKPHFDFTFDPLTVFKHELNNTIQGKSDGPSSSPTLTTAAKSELQVLLDNVSYSNLNLPGSMEKDLKSWKNVTKASCIILLVVCVMSLISTIIQILAFCFSPNHCMLSFLNFLFLFATMVLSFITAVMATALNLFIRNEVNKHTDTFGVKSFVSINYYAFVWSAIVAGAFAIVWFLIGHCFGLCGSGRKRFRDERHHDHDDASIAYEHDHKGGSDHEHHHRVSDSD